MDEQFDSIMRNGGLVYLEYAKLSILSHLRATERGLTIQEVENIFNELRSDINSQKDILAL